MCRREIPLLLGFALWAASAFGPPAIRGLRRQRGRLQFSTTAQPPGQATPAWISIRNVNNLPNGYRISCAPLDVGSISKDGKLALVMVPKAGDGALTVLDPRSAAVSTEWTVPFAPRIGLVVYAPRNRRSRNEANALATHASTPSSDRRAMHGARAVASR